ncbi:hypothetical protein AOQ84DRAFT_98342 [Glonium stellatum]|uniref:Uncharacterized protein n=1 Tax=Glonium stellatum TaxID=574774 RepID=A0A8E2JQ46_9PEZI|nr:hypothetical protein AOQ84DRAFT_98342 [Glonium stellatum]
MTGIRRYCPRPRISTIVHRKWVASGRVDRDTQHVCRLLYRCASHLSRFYSVSSGASSGPSPARASRQAFEWWTNNLVPIHLSIMAFQYHIVNPASRLAPLPLSHASRASSPPESARVTLRHCRYFFFLCFFQVRFRSPCPCTPPHPVPLPPPPPPSSFLLPPSFTFEQKQIKKRGEDQAPPDRNQRLQLHAPLVAAFSLTGGARHANNARACQSRPAPKTKFLPCDVRLL